MRMRKRRANPAASVDAPTAVGLRWLRLGRRATEQQRLGGNVNEGAMSRRSSAAKRLESRSEPERVEEQLWHDEQCKSEVKEKSSRELVSWLERTKHEKELGEMDRREALRFAKKLYALGAVKVWAVRIEHDEDGAEYSRRLIIALPDSAGQQGKIFKLCADPARPYLDGSAPAARVGKHFMSVYLM